MHSRPDPDARSPRLAVWGVFDVDDLGAALALRAARAELVRRVPTAEVRAFSPEGFRRPSRFDGGRPAEPADHFDPDWPDGLVVVPAGAASGDGGFPPPDGLACTAASVDGLAVLAPGLVEPEVRAKRMAWMRLMGWWPEAGPVVVVEAGPAGTDVEAVAKEALRVTADVEGASLVVARLGSAAGESGVAEALAGALDRPCLVLPEIAGVEDLVAVLEAADAMVAASPVGVLVRCAFGRPVVTALDVPDVHEVRARAGARLDDLVAEAAAFSERRDDGSSAWAVLARRVRELEEELAAARAAYDERHQQVVDERIRFADLMEDTEREHAEALARRDAELADLRRALAGETAARSAAEAEVAALRQTFALQAQTWLRRLWERWV